MTVKMTDNLSAFLQQEAEKQDGAMAEMAIDIMTRAQLNAPKASNALVRSAKVKRNSDGDYSVTFGDNSVRYATRRHYENKKNPGTLLYLEKAGESVSRGNMRKYFR